MRFKFIKYTWLWFLISGLAIATSFGAMIKNKIVDGSALNYGIDFTGGSLMELSLKSDKDITMTLRDSIEKVIPSSVNQITRTSEGYYDVQTKEINEADLKKVVAGLGEDFKGIELIRFTSIGPKIGATLKQKALTAIFIASLAIILYIAYAFRKVPKRVSPWRFGICAVIALAHDVIIPTGLFAVMGYEVDALFITAILTVMGFSVHDTIVVFDRIRENLKKQGRDDTFGKIADDSLNQTLSRSINTSFATLLPLLAIFFLGAESIHHFILALIFGIFVGTYSSIFIASPVLTMWQEKRRIR
jgi:preprotein translocase subunit SecF